MFNPISNEKYVNCTRAWIDRFWKNNFFVPTGFFGIFNPILLNRNSKGKLRQLHSGMDRFWKKKIFLIPGYSGIFNPNTLTPFS